MARNSTVTASDSKGRSIARPTGFQNGAIERKALEKQTSAARSEVTRASQTQRESGDQVNRFLLCALISESAKHIKARAEKAGESLPMTMIVRGVLRAYRVAAKDKYGPLAERELDVVGLRRLNEKVLRDVIALNSRDRVKNSETRLAYAERLGDDARVKAEKDGLERAIELRDRLAMAVK